ncbi:uncharacterized protein TRIADDRAFT_19040 [Trichoplax adhaerens]|uniref:MORN repeat-containing protein 3 n=1 Tax=Trichoplax adhaerens TaxID=10228 RepID=B3RJW7_TRIAD|nr:hypothetical protein TRIADDRAFT_19040 [Trichoplax adhaerens]EDV29133.1 hypothetical protein TRIADDRAFT_19040 [Trichoplax adhaerens]|eukprot:XP_002108335.1 hypothetical protein TRIADDRAFT_19040 [Trichoplax adhaerens]
MPIEKQPKIREPMWHEWDDKAQKKGIHHTVYTVNGDHYTGDWSNNKKNGKGTQFWKKSGTIYDGDWKDNKRHGFGTLSVPVKNGYRKVYSGGWKNGMRHGYGTNFYSPTEYYEGEWYANKRSGWGRMYFEDGSIYEGEWFNDLRNGEGMLRLATGNRYEGSWKDDLKHGAGKFYYLDKGQLYEGTWRDNIPKCGNMVDYARNEATRPTQYQLPENKLQNPDAVMREAEEKLEEDETE